MTVDKFWKGTMRKTHDNCKVRPRVVEGSTRTETLWGGRTPPAGVKALRGWSDVRLGRLLTLCHVAWPGLLCLCGVQVIASIDDGPMLLQQFQSSNVALEEIQKSLEVSQLSPNPNPDLYLDPDPDPCLHSRSLSRSLAALFNAEVEHLPRWLRVDGDEHGLADDVL